MSTYRVIIETISFIFECFLGHDVVQLSNHLMLHHQIKLVIIVFADKLLTTSCARINIHGRANLSLALTSTLFSLCLCSVWPIFFFVFSFFSLVSLLPSFCPASLTLTLRFPLVSRAVSVYHSFVHHSVRYSFRLLFLLVVIVCSIALPVSQIHPHSSSSARLLQHLSTLILLFSVDSFLCLRLFVVWPRRFSRCHSSNRLTKHLHDTNNGNHVWLFALKYTRSLKMPIIP